MERTATKIRQHVDALIRGEVLEEPDFKIWSGSPQEVLQIPVPTKSCIQDRGAKRQSTLHVSNINNDGVI